MNITFKTKQLVNVDSERALSSVVEHYLHTPLPAEGNAPRIDSFSSVFTHPVNVLSNKVSNTRRFQRVEPGVQRHVRTGELWFVGRRSGRVIWRRLQTANLSVARIKVAFMKTYINGNTEISLVVDGNVMPLSKADSVQPDVPLRRVRQVTVDEHEATPSPGKVTSADRPRPSGAVPTLENFILSWRRAKEGLKPGTLVKLDAHLNIMRRYVETKLPVTEYPPQKIREFIAKARADKDEKDRRRLKGQTINASILRPLFDAFALAEEDGWITRNPMDSIKPEKAEPIVREQLKWKEAERVLDEVKARGNRESYLELKFMLLMGVGQAEVKAFTGEAVDWQENQITFIRQKTKKPFQVPIYPWAKEFISTEISPLLQRGKLVFTWRNPRKALETACNNLGVTSVDIRSLRRTLIIHLIEQKMEIRLIAKWQGHCDARLILSRYGAYIDGDYEKEALAGLKAGFDLKA